MSLAPWIFGRSPLRRRARMARLAMILWPGATIATPYGPRLVKRDADLTFRLAVTGAYGRYISDIIEGQAEPFHFVDVGANQGIYSLLAAGMAQCRSVLAFEPTPETFAFLARNVAANGAGKVAMLCAAIAGEDTPIVRLSRDPRHSGTASIVGGNGDTPAITVSGEALRQLWPADDGAPVLMKIDVEGAETIVLDALDAAGVLGRVDGIIIELNDDAAGAGHGARVIERLNAGGFVQQSRSAGETHYDAHFVAAGRAGRTRP